MTVFKELMSLSSVLLMICVNSIQGQCPNRCSCQLNEQKITVNCWGRDLLAFPADIDDKVNTLELSNNSIAFLPANLEEYSSLEGLFLSKNRIQAISKTTFFGLLNLQLLDLSENQISDISQINANTFIVSNTQLHVLNLSKNPIANLGTETNSFTSILTSASLEKLDVSHCKINSISGNLVLSRLPNLKFLDLSFNPIKWIRDFGSVSLQSLDLSYCELDYLSTNTLTELPSLKNLSLNGNTALAIPRLISTNLTHFEAAYCSLTRPALQNLRSLVHANLRGNKIGSLAENEFDNNRYLKILDLSENSIATIYSTTFKGAEYLENLNLARNSIENELPPEIFSENKYLKHLNLSSNKITSMNNLKNPSLKYLDLSRCKIKELNKDTFLPLPWLMTLRLSENQLEDIPDDIFSLSIFNLDLSYCRLSTIRNGTFRGLSQLVRLDLTGNRFTDPIKVYVLQNLTRLSGIWIGDNPWRCDCKSAELKNLWLYLNEPYQILKSRPDEVRCQSPESVSGSKWESACYNDWYPIKNIQRSVFDHYGVIVLVSIFSIAALLLVVLTIRKGIVSRKKRMDDMDRQSREARLMQERLRRQHQESLEYQSDDNISVDIREYMDERRPRQVSQPPTYEEAVLLPRLRASQEELETSSAVVAETRTIDEQPNRSRRSSVSSSRSADSNQSSSLSGVSPSGSESDPVTGDSEQQRDTERPSKKHIKPDTST